MIGRERIKGQPCGYEDLPIDGIVELWFDDAAAMQAGFASPAGQAATTHAKEFLAEITTFAVGEHRVVLSPHPFLVSSSLDHSGAARHDYALMTLPFV